MWCTCAHVSVSHPHSCTRTHTIAGIIAAAITSVFLVLLVIALSITLILVYSWVVKRRDAYKPAKEPLANVQADRPQDEGIMAEQKINVIEIRNGFNCSAISMKTGASFESRKEEVLIPDLPFELSRERNSEGVSF